MYVANTSSGYLERIIRLVAGAIVLGSTTRGFLLDPIWFIMSGLVGGMLVLFALTGFCPMSIILYLFGARERCKC